MKLKLNLRQVRIAIFATALIILAGGIGFRLGRGDLEFNSQRISPTSIQRTQPQEKKDLEFNLFWEVWDHLLATYLDKEELDGRKMIYGAIKGMVASTGDPYTVFLDPEENSQAKEDLNGAFGGVGIQLGYKKNQLAVIAPLSGMPAEKAGLRAGDLILKIEEKETVGISLPEAVRLIRGPEGSKIKLTLLHEGEDEPYEVEIVRGTIVVPSVELEFKEIENCKLKIENCIVAHLQLVRFGDRTADEWHQAVAEILAEESLEGIILDLRNNPGGYLEGSVFIVSEFIPSGVVVYQENANGQKQAYSVDREGQLFDYPLVILVNEGSASASEIVAGALRDHRQAKIVGEKTFGKGTIQEAQELQGGAGLHITTARWLLPDEESIDGVGIAPDYEIEDNLETEEVDEQLEKGIEVLLQN